jgi:hypothetical protein
MGELTAKALRYLIALEQAPPAAHEADIIELGYDATRPPSLGIPAKYCNLRDEKNAGIYAPYLPPDDIDSTYHEPAPDPSGPGFWANLRAQLARAVDQGFRYVELDNLDTYDVGVALRCFNEVREHNLKVFVKNPLLVTGEETDLLRHAAAEMIIVERGGGNPRSMHDLRMDVGRPYLPVRFVAYGDGQAWAFHCGRLISEHGYIEMGVTYSLLGEYASSQDIRVPEPPPPADAPPMVTITTTGTVTIVVNGRTV